MANQAIWIGIVIGVFFVGIGVSYAIFSSSYDPNSEIMSEHGMIEDSMMNASPIEQHETMLELVEEIMEEKELRDHMFAHIIEDQELVHQMFSLMDSNPELREHMEAHVTGDTARYENP